MTAEIKITSLTLGSPKATDVEPAVDTTDTTMAATGTTKKYIRSDVMTYMLGLLGYDTIAPCRLATTGALTVTYANGALGVGATLTNAGAMAALSIDGVAVAVNDRILVKDQASALQNGIYTVTAIGSGAANWVLTRATDWDVSAEMLNDMPVAVNLGTVNNNTLWQSDVTVPVVVGTDAINFSAFNITGSLTIPLPLASGGTNKIMVASAGSLVWCDANSFEFTAVGSSGQFMYSTGTTAPAWSVPTYPIASGALGRFLQSDATNNVYSAYTLPTAVPAVGKILRSDGTNLVGSTATYPDVATTAGTMLRADGTNWVASTSTYADTYLINTILYNGSANTVTGLAPSLSSVLLSSAASTGVPTWSGALTNGQLIIGSTGATPAVATLTAGAGISISNGAGSITISSGGSGFSWTEVTGTSQAMAVNNGYVANNAALVTLTLPDTAAIGDSVTVVGKGAGLFRIAQNAGETIRFVSSSTTTGVGGSLTAIEQYAAIELVCITANTDWAVTDSAGNFTIV